MKAPARRTGAHNSHLLSHIRLGDEIEVWWPYDRQYYQGVVAALLANGHHRIHYDDGEVEELQLSTEQWRFRGVAATRVTKAIVRNRDSTAPPLDAPSPSDDAPLENRRSSAPSPAPSSSDDDDQLPVRRASASSGKNGAVKKTIAKKRRPSPRRSSAPAQLSDKPMITTSGAASSAKHSAKPSGKPSAKPTRPNAASGHSSGVGGAGKKRVSALDTSSDGKHPGASDAQRARPEPEVVELDPPPEPTLQPDAPVRAVGTTDAGFGAGAIAAEKKSAARRQTVGRKSDAGSKVANSAGTPVLSPSKKALPSKRASESGVEAAGKKDAMERKKASSELAGKPNAAGKKPDAVTVRAVGETPAADDKPMKRASGHGPCSLRGANTSLTASQQTPKKRSLPVPTARGNDPTRSTSMDDLPGVPRRRPAVLSSPVIHAGGSPILGVKRMDQDKLFSVDRNVSGTNMQVRPNVGDAVNTQGQGNPFVVRPPFRSVPVNSAHKKFAGDDKPVVSESPRTKQRLASGAPGIDNDNGATTKPTTIVLGAAKPNTVPDLTKDNTKKAVAAMKTPPTSGAIVAQDMLSIPKIIHTGKNLGTGIASTTDKVGEKLSPQGILMPENKAPEAPGEETDNPKVTGKRPMTNVTPSVKRQRTGEATSALKAPPSGPNSLNGKNNIPQPLQGNGADSAVAVTADMQGGTMRAVSGTELPKSVPQPNKLSTSPPTVPIPSATSGKQTAKSGNPIVATQIQTNRPAPSLVKALAPSANAVPHGQVVKPDGSPEPMEISPTAREAMAKRPRAVDIRPQKQPVGREPGRPSRFEPSKRMELVQDRPPEHPQHSQGGNGVLELSPEQTMQLSAAVQKAAAQDKVMLKERIDAQLSRETRHSVPMPAKADGSRKATVPPPAHKLIPTRATAERARPNVNDEDTDMMTDIPPQTTPTVHAPNATVPSVGINPAPSLVPPQQGVHPMNYIPNAPQTGHPGSGSGPVGGTPTAPRSKVHAQKQLGVATPNPKPGTPANLPHNPTSKPTQPVVNRGRNVGRVTQNAEKGTASLPLDILMRTITESNMRSLQSRLTPLSSRIDQQFAKNEEVLKKLTTDITAYAKQTLKLTNGHEVLRKAMEQSVSKTSLISAVSALTSKILTTVRTEMHQVTRKMQDDLAKDFANSMKETSSALANGLRKDMDLMIKTAIDATLASRRIDSSAGQLGPPPAIPSGSTPTANTAAVADTVKKPANASGESSLLNRSTLSSAAGSGDGKGTQQDGGGASSQPSEFRKMEYGKIAKQARELVGRAVVEWFLSGGCRDLAPSTERHEPVSNNWVMATSKKCLETISAKLDTYSKYEEAMEALKKSLAQVSLELDWIVQGPTSENLSRARQNYTGWDPSLLDFEWESERQVLSQVAQEFIRTEKSLMSKRMRVTEPLPSALRTVQVTLSRLGGGW